jgi:hypothetical protein
MSAVSHLRKAEHMLRTYQDDSTFRRRSYDQCFWDSQGVFSIDFLIEANIHLDSEEIPHVQWNPEVHYRLPESNAFSIHPHAMLLEDPFQYDPSIYI